MREVRAKPGVPIWREGENGRGVRLMIPRAGRNAVCVEDEAGERDRQSPSASGASAPLADASFASGSLRPGSKQALIVAMLSKDERATLDALIAATGWLPHATRAALTGLRKRGYLVERSRDEAKGSLHRIARDKALARALRPRIMPEKQAGMLLEQPQVRSWTAASFRSSWSMKA